MGCAGSSQSKADGTVKKIRKPKPWKHPQPITKSQLMQLRDEFWDTAPHYGGRKEIWDALRAAAEADLSLAQAIVDSAGVIVQSADLTICYDERGAKYELPKYVLSEPTNLIREGNLNMYSSMFKNQKRFSDDVIEDDSVSRRVRSLGLYETVAD
ncbi:UBD domain-containing protein [Citrus sinensis]|uniref:UBD domain-containing protein n=1 Tax=Citrus sinensis TaxID=2711 RepID=A0ACB8M0I8_CITSI|nr:UBD domain-containing protein [Citrus sinensis]